VYYRDIEIPREKKRRFLKISLRNLAVRHATSTLGLGVRSTYYSVGGSPGSGVICTDYVQEAVEAGRDNSTSGAILLVGSNSRQATTEDLLEYTSTVAAVELY